MKAVTIHEYGGPEELIYEDVPMPHFGPDEILVKIQATSINPIDWKTREGHKKERKKLDFPFILGWDVAGAVADSGNLVSGFAVGDLVFALADMNRNGAEAESMVLKNDAGARMPAKLSLKIAEAGRLNA